MAACAATVGGAIAIWESGLKERVLPKRFGVVDEGSLFRSGQIHPAIIESTLRKHDIDVIIDLAADDTEASRAELGAASRLGIEDRLFPLAGDGTGDIENYAQAIKSMVDAKRQGDAALVHCVAGGSRTGGVVAMYRVFVEGWSTERARDEMLAFGWKPKKSELPGYLNDHMQELAERLVALGVIERVPDPLPRFPTAEQR